MRFMVSLDFSARSICILVYDVEIHANVMRQLVKSD